MHRQKRGRHAPWERELVSEYGSGWTKMNRQLFNATDLGERLDRTLRTTVDRSFCVPDIRVARLLLVLSELETCVAGLQDLPDPDLTELVSSAIVACGFTDPAEVRYAIAEVLEAIEVPGLHPTSDSGAAMLS